MYIFVIRIPGRVSLMRVAHNSRISSAASQPTESDPKYHPDLRRWAILRSSNRPPTVAATAPSCPPFRHSTGSHNASLKIEDQRHEIGALAPNPHFYDILAPSTGTLDPDAGTMGADAQVSLERRWLQGWSFPMTSLPRSDIP